MAAGLTVELVKPLIFTRMTFLIGTGRTYKLAVESPHIPEKEMV